MFGPDATLAPALIARRLTVDACYDRCHEMVREHSRSFALSSRFLPYAKRRAVWAAYAFCRTADDIVDRRSPAPERLAAIDAWEQQLLAAYDGRATDPIFIAFADAVQRFGIPIEPALDLLRGSRMDITVDRYATFEALCAYCYLVASTVGVMMLPVLGSVTDDALPYAVQLGRAMQITNILRDVGEDAELGRIYLPAEDLARFSYTEHDVFEHTIDRRFVTLMQFQIERARTLYHDAEPGIALLMPESRYAVRLALHLYRGILGAIEANGYNVFTMRAFVPMRAKMTTALGLFLRG